jgi:hypothetical protein
MENSVFFFSYSLNATSVEGMGEVEKKSTKENAKRKNDSLLTLNNVNVE